MLSANKILNAALANDSRAGIARTQADKNSDYSVVKDFGALGDGATDDSTAVGLANTSATATGEAVKFPDGVYPATGLTISNPIEMSAGASLLHNGAQNSTLLTISAASKTHGSIGAKADGVDCTLINLSGDENSIESISLRDGVASATSSTSIFGLVVPGDGNHIGHVSVYSFANTGQSNESFPQAILFQGDNNHIDSVFIDGCASGLNASSISGSNSVDSVVVRNATDNGVYHLGGTLSIGTLDYEGDNEPFVCKGGSAARFNVGHCKNNGTGIAGIEDGGDIFIDHLEIGSNAASIFRTRSGQTSSGRVHIRKITGDFTGSTLWSIATGTVDYLTIDEMDVTYRYDAAVGPTISRWADFSACKGFQFGTLRIRIIDVNDALTSSASRFTIRAPTTNLAYNSFVGNIIVTIEKSDGKDSPALMRGIGFFSDPRIHVENAYVERSGPFLREVAKDQSIAGVVFDGTSAPSAGSYRVGQTVFVNAPAEGDPIGYICTATPSTWEPFGIAPPAAAQSRR